MANNEWRTPPQYIESARKVMGSIDVDPASSDKANEVVKASCYYTKDRPGFSFKWQGNVWLNPPYGRGLAKPFAEALCRHYASGHSKQAIVLTNNVADTGWWRSTLGQACSMVCLLDHRVAFINPETGEPERGNDRNQMIAYLGSNTAGFIAEFSQYGLCCLPVRAAA